MGKIRTIKIEIPEVDLKFLKDSLEAKKSTALDRVLFSAQSVYESYLDGDFKELDLCLKELGEALEALSREDKNL